MCPPPAPAGHDIREGQADPKSLPYAYVEVTPRVVDIRRQSDKIARTRGSFKRNKEPPGGRLEQSDANDIADPEPNYSGAAPVLECGGLSLDYARCMRIG